MHTFEYMTGVWQIETRSQEIGDSRCLAVVSALSGKNKEMVRSRHFFIFGDNEDFDEADEVSEEQRLMQEILSNNH